MTAPARTVDESARRLARAAAAFRVIARLIRDQLDPGGAANRAASKWRRTAEKQGAAFVTPAGARMGLCLHCGALDVPGHLHAGIAVIDARAKVALGRCDTCGGRAATTRDEDGDPICAECASLPGRHACEQDARPASVTDTPAPVCPGCLRAEARARELRNASIWVPCEICGATISASVGPNCALDMRDLARHAPDVFGRGLELREGVGIGGAHSGRADRVDEARGYSRAVAALRRMRRMIADGHGDVVAIVWAAFGLTGDMVPMASVNERVAVGFAPARLRERWREADETEGRPGLRGQLATAWGCEQLAPFWDGVGTVPRDVGWSLAMGFAPAFKRVEWSKTRSERVRATEAAAWGQLDLGRAAARYARPGAPRTAVSDP